MLQNCTQRGCSETPPLQPNMGNKITRNSALDLQLALCQHKHIECPPPRLPVQRKPVSEPFDIEPTLHPSGLIYRHRFYEIGRWVRGKKRGEIIERTDW